MVFFVVYTAYEGTYRQTGWVLIFFTSLFILAQYFYSLFYQIYMIDDKEHRTMIRNLYWWNFFPNANYDYKNEESVMNDPFRITPGASIYFRFPINFEDWFNIFLMKLLREVNIMYTTESLSEYRLRQEALHVLAEKTGSLGYYFARVKRIFLGIFNKLVIAALVCVQAITQPSIITWFFFALNLMNLSYMMKGSRKARELKIQFGISSTIKFYSLVVIMANVIVLSMSYIIDSPPYANTRKWLQIIGLKANMLDYQYIEELKRIDPDIELTPRMMEHMALRARMIAMVIFFLSSIYLCNLFAGQMKQADEDENFGEDDYRKLFEYKIDKKKGNHNKQDEFEDSEGDRIGK